jgi:hypothetical protein
MLMQEWNFLCPGTDLPKVIKAPSKSIIIFILTTYYMDLKVDFSTGDCKREWLNRLLSKVKDPSDLTNLHFARLFWHQTKAPGYM